MLATVDASVAALGAPAGLCLASGAVPVLGSAPGLSNAAPSGGGSGEGWTMAWEDDDIHAWEDDSGIAAP